MKHTIMHLLQFTLINCIVKSKGEKSSGLYNALKLKCLRHRSIKKQFHDVDARGGISIIHLILKIIVFFSCHIKTTYFVMPSYKPRVIIIQVNK